MKDKLRRIYSRDEISTVINQLRKVNSSDFNVENIERNPEVYFRHLEAEGIGIIFNKDEEMKKFKGNSIPELLYYRGNKFLMMGRTVGFVGSRKASSYGLNATSGIIRCLDLSFVTVSGGAYGIDSMCHRESIGRGIKTICVLGGGILKPYPKENIRLFEDIEKSGGLILSEYPPSLRPRKYFFPERNRIIAELSDLLVLPEASEKSGSMHTVEYMVELNKDVVVVPHMINTANGRGNNLLIKAGFPLLTEYEEIKDYL